MTNLTQFKTEDGIEILIDTNTGESFCSVSGYARMSGISQQAISNRVEKLDNQIEVKTAELDTGYGVKLHKLINEVTVAQWIVKDNPELASKMLVAGVRVFLHTQAGYEVKSTAVEPQQHTIDNTNKPIHKTVRQYIQDLRTLGVKEKQLRSGKYRAGLDEIFAGYHTAVESTLGDVECKVELDTIEQDILDWIIAHGGQANARNIYRVARFSKTKVGGRFINAKIANDLLTQIAESGYGKMVKLPGCSSLTLVLHPSTEIQPVLVK